MGTTRTGTVGYSYRDWAGIFYPQGAPLRRQLNIYCQNFNTCELTQFTHQMPDADRVAHFASQIKTDLTLFVRIHNTFTHCADVGLALSVAKHFRRAMEPLFEAGKLGGLVAAFPYAYKNCEEARDYIQQLSGFLSFKDTPLQLDFRHPSWLTDGCVKWMRDCGLGLVCVDEPELPGLVPARAEATAKKVLVRLHGRNADSWWSGNSTTRYDYSYNVGELQSLQERYAPVIQEASEVSFVFQNHWQAQSVQNAMQWRALVEEAPKQPTQEELGRSFSPRISMPTFSVSSVQSANMADNSYDDEALRPPTSLPLSEVKSRVSRALCDLQEALDLPARSQE